MGANLLLTLLELTCSLPIGSQADAFGGFDVLRHDETDAVLTTQVHLPDPNITATARRRNEELLEGEMMLDADSMDIEKAEAEKYFNDKG